MKRLLLILFAIFLIASPVQGEFFKDIVVTSPTGIWTDSRAYTTLNAAVTAIGASEQDLYIAKEEVVTTLVIPANIRLHFLKDGAIANSNTLTINTKNIHADHQIFTGAGAVNFAFGTEVRTRWFEDFETAITQTANDTVTLLVDTVDTLDNSTAVGNNVLLKWNASNLITITVGQTLSNIGDIDAPGFQLFVVSGAVAFKTPSPLKEIRADWFGNTLATLDIADNAATVAEKLLVITPGDWVIDNDLTLSSDIKVLPNVDLQIATTKTLTINGTFDVGRYKIFSCTGTGKVVLTKAREVSPEWWAVNTSPGTTDMTAAVQAALIAGEGASLYLANTYLVSSDMMIPGAIRVYGPGKLTAAEWVFPTVGQPPVDITATGTLGAGVAYGSAIAIGETSFTVANSFAAGDLLLLSNLPVAQADRRNELLIVSTATGAGFTTTTGVLQTYADTTDLQFQKVTPVEGIHFESVNIENINLMFTLCRNYSVTNSRIRKGFVSNNRCSDFALDFKNFDSEYSGCLIDIQGMSRNFRVTGNFSGGVGVSGNALIKTNGAAYYTVDANVNGSVNGGGTMSAFLADTLYTDNPTGYDYQVNCYFSARINSQDVYGVAAELGWVNTMPVDTQPHDFYLDGQWGANGATIKGKDGIVAGISKGGYLILAYTSGIIVQNDAYAGITFTGTNTGVQGLWVEWTPTITGSTGTAPEPAMSAVTKGRYRQIGKTIEVRAIYDWTDAGSRTGLLCLNLPFVAESTANLQAPLSLGYSVGLEAGKSMRAVVQQGTSTARIYYDESTQQALTATGTLTMGGIYEIGY